MIDSESIKLDSLNMCNDISKINDGDLIVIQRKSDKRNLLAQVKEVLYRGTGKEEVILSKGKNDYFVWSMYQDGAGWVRRVWHLPNVELTAITNNINEFPRR